jgi:hypothetical protein
VGIGTSSPVAKLAVVGGTSNASDLATAYSLASFNITPKSTSGYSLQFGSGPSDFPYVQMSAAGAAAGDMTLQPYGGNVGIGTTSAGSRLDTRTSGSTVANFQSTAANGGYMTYVGGSTTYIGATLAFLGTGTASDFGIVGSGANNFIFGTSSAEKMRITSAGSVGIGTSSPLSALDVSNSFITVSKGAATTGRIGASDYIVGGTDNDFVLQSSGTGVTRFVQTGSEKARITSGGNLLVGTSTSRTGSDSLSLEPANSLIWFQKNGTASQSQVVFQRDTTGSPTIVGSISTSGTSTAYNTSSDYRLKENWVAVADASTRVNALKPVNFAWIASGERVDGFLAHELAEVVPEAVTGEKDAVDAEGNPVYQGIDQSKLVPLLTAALQEALAQIESLTARVSALEGN